MLATGYCWRASLNSTSDLSALSNSIRVMPTDAAMIDPLGGVKRAGTTLSGSHHWATSTASGSAADIESQPPSLDGRDVGQVPVPANVAGPPVFLPRFCAPVVLHHIDNSFQLRQGYAGSGFVCCVSSLDKFYNVLRSIGFTRSVAESEAANGLVGWPGVPVRVLQLQRQEAPLEPVHREVCIRQKLRQVDATLTVLVGRARPVRNGCGCEARRAGRSPLAEEEELAAKGLPAHLLRKGGQQVGIKAKPRPGSSLTIAVVPKPSSAPPRWQRLLRALRSALTNGAYLL